MKAPPTAYLYTRRGVRSFSPTRLAHCIALGWHETPLYEEPRASKLELDHAKAVGWNEAIKCAATIVQFDKEMHEAVLALDKSMEAIEDREDGIS